MLPPTEWKTVKQPAGSKVCGAAVAAMVVGQPLEYALERMESTPSADGDPFYKTSELLKFIGGHGIVPGKTFRVDGTIVLHKDDSIRFCDVSMQNVYAILSVKSRGFEGNHFVFWDSCNVRDPDMCEPETSDIKDYKIQEICPLTYLDESGEDSE